MVGSLSVPPPRFARGTVLLARYFLCSGYDFLNTLYHHLLVSDTQIARSNFFVKQMSSIWFLTKIFLESQEPARTPAVRERRSSTWLVLTALNRFGLISKSIPLYRGRV